MGKQTNKGKQPAEAATSTTTTTTTPSSSSLSSSTTSTSSITKNKTKRKRGPTGPVGKKTHDPLGHAKVSSLMRKNQVALVQSIRGGQSLVNVDARDAPATRYDHDSVERVFESIGGEFIPAPGWPYKVRLLPDAERAMVVNPDAALTLRNAAKIYGRTTTGLSGIDVVGRPTGGPVLLEREELRAALEQDLIEPTRLVRQSNRLHSPFGTHKDDDGLNADDEGNVGRGPTEWKWESIGDNPSLSSHVTEWMFGREGPITDVRWVIWNDLRARGYTLLDGIKFGGVWMAYVTDPAISHSTYVVIPKEWNESIRPTELALVGRLAASSSKVPLIASVNPATGKASYTQLSWAGAT